MTAYERLHDLAEQGLKLDSTRHITAYLNMDALGMSEAHTFPEDVLTNLAKVLGSLTANLHYYESDHDPHRQGLDRLQRSASNAGDVPVHCGAIPFGERWARSDVRDVVREILPGSTPRDFATVFGFWTQCMRAYNNRHGRWPSVLALDHAKRSQLWAVGGDSPPTERDHRIVDAWLHIRQILLRNDDLLDNMTMYGFPFGKTVLPGVVPTYSHSNYLGDMSRDDKSRMGSLRHACPISQPMSFWYNLGGRDDRAMAIQHRTSRLYEDVRFIFYFAPTTSEAHLASFCDYVEGWTEGQE